MRIQNIITAIILYGYGQSAAAGSFPARGPGLAIETRNPNASENLGSDDESAAGSLTTTRSEAWLLAPIPAAILSGLVTIQANLTSESDRSIFNQPRSPDDSTKILVPAGEHKENRYATKFGFIWHPHHKEGAPRYYIAAGRTGLPDTTKTIRPLMSFTLGSNISEDDMPLPISFSPTDITETRLFATVHRFPGYNRFEVGAGHRIKTKNGFLLDLMIPRHVLTGYSYADDLWSIYGGLTRQLEFFPWTTAVDRGWSEDLVEKRKLAFKVKIFSPLYLVLEAGQVRQHRQRYTYDNVRAGELQTSFAPFARLAVESWLPVL